MSEERQGVQEEGEAEMIDALVTEAGDAHYLRQVTDMGDRCRVEAREPIQAANGMRLVDAGARVDSTLYDKLVRHKLLRPIDASLAAEGGVTVSSLIGDARRLVESESCLERLLEGSGFSGRSLRVLAGVTLHPALAFKLTVCREQARIKYDHLLRVALVSSVLGSRLRMGDNELIDLVAAGLFHDLGELHVDPRYFEHGRPLSGDERRQIYAHPVIGYLMLREFPLYHPVVSRAVLHHHERFDGSGYPQGLVGERISRAGRILGVSELLVVMMQRGGEATDPEQVRATLLLNADRYGRDLVTPMVEVITRQGCGRREGGEEERPAVDPAALRDRMEGLAVLLLELPEAMGGEEAEGFVAEQCRRLAFVAADSGLSPVTGREYLEALEEDPEALQEMDLHTRELLYQLTGVAHEARRRWGAEIREGVLSRWLEQVDTLNERIDPAQSPPTDGSVSAEQ
ncbi:MAG: hypothetical protein Kow006_05110 [Gammaproteobacteria bacterium]